MTIMQFLTYFLLLTVCGTLAVTGWFFITRGEEEMLPDGTTKQVGKIFKAWYFFWTKVKPERTLVFYKGEQFVKLIGELGANYPQVHFHVRGDRFTILASPRPTFDLEAEIEAKWEVQLLATVETDGTWLQAYKSYPKYVFPELVRTPLAECATCFSSIYGSLFYWLSVWLVQAPLFEWSSMPVLAAIFFWATFCFELSVLNTALAKKI